MLVRDALLLPATPLLLLLTRAALLPAAALSFGLLKLPLLLQTELKVVRSSWDEMFAVLPLGWQLRLPATGLATGLAGLATGDAASHISSFAIPAAATAVAYLLSATEYAEPGFAAARGLLLPLAETAAAGGVTGTTVSDT